jgi:transcription termination factor Rho
LIQSGVLDVLPDGFGFLRTNGYSQSKGDVYVSTSQIKRFGLRRGDFIVGQIRPARDGEKYPAMVRIETVNGKEPQKGRWRPNFDDLTPLYPQERLRLEWKPNDIAPRVIDLVAPIGKGQRGLVVSPPKAGKTTILKQIAQSIAANYPEVKLMVLLADERPEEVTDWERSVKEAEVVASTFDQPAENHTAVAELVLERIKRLVEEGEDVVVLLDGITRLSRAYNLAAPASGRILSGGVDSAALYPPKKFFGAARNIENGGSLTILATALVETGSRMDEVIFEEFKGTGNMELRLDRKLANRRVYPAINIEDSGTRKEELLMESAEAQRVWQVRSILNALDTSQKIELLIQKLKETRTNAEFLRELQRVR